MLRTSYSVLSTIAASAGDITVSQGYISITGCPRMKYSQIYNAGQGYVIKSAEAAGVITVTPTATAGVTYTLVITQFRGDLGRTVTEVLSYIAVTGDTATIICNVWRAQLALFEDLYVTGSGTATFIVTAGSSSATTGKFGSCIIGITSTSGTNSVAATSAVAMTITGISTATPMVVTATTDVVAGQTVTITGVVGMPEANGTFLVGTVTSTTAFQILNYYTGANTVGVGTWSSGGKAVHGAVSYSASTTSQGVGNQSRGYYWDLVAAGVNPALITIGKTYNQIIFDYGTREGGAIKTESECQHTLYVQDDATNFANFATRIVELTHDFTASGTTADPLNAALV